MTTTAAMASQVYKALISAKPTNDIRLAGVIVDCAGNGPQDRIARKMAMAVVDHLEVVEIDENEPRLGLVALHMSEAAIKLSFKATSIQNVEKRVSLDLRFELTDPLPGGREVVLQASEAFENRP